MPGSIRWLFGGARSRSPRDDEDVAGRAFGEQAVAEQHGLGRARVDRDLAQQHVAEQRDRLDVAPTPAVVGRGDRSDAVLDLLAGWRGERAAHHEHGRRRVLRKGMIALWRRRASPAGRRTDPATGGARRAHAAARVQSAAECGLAMRSASRLFCSRARCSAQPERRARIDRDHFVHAVAEDEAAVEHRHAGLRERQPCRRSGRRSSRSLRQPEPDHVDARARRGRRRGRSPAPPADIRRAACPPARA